YSSFAADVLLDARQGRTAVLLFRPPAPFPSGRGRASGYRKKGVAPLFPFFFRPALSRTPLPVPLPRFFLNKAGRRAGRQGRTRPAACWGPGNSCPPLN